MITFFLSPLVPLQITPCSSATGACNSHAVTVFGVQLRLSGIMKLRFEENGIIKYEYLALQFVVFGVIPNTLDSSHLMAA